MARFIVEIVMDNKAVDDLHEYMITTTDGNLGFVDVLQENIEDLVRSMEPKASAHIIEITK